MRKLRVGIVDLVAKAPTTKLWGRTMNANLAGIMGQVAAVWCEEEGHEVHFVCYTGRGNVLDDLPDDVDLLIVSAFTQAAQLSYAISALARERGAVTCLGGPHARCYPQDAQKYYDYVLGFTDKDTLREVLDDCQPHRPMGLCLNALQQPRSLPSVRARWKYIEAALEQSPAIKIVPMIGSLGCPYTCPFCIDSEVPYQPLDFEELKEDLRFLLTKYKKPIVGWHDPNFGVRFNDYLNAIEEAAPGGRIRHIAESSLSLLSEPHVARMKENGFKGLLPGIESWFDLGNKSKTGARQGMDKVHQVANHANTIMGHVPYLQTNFVFGLDSDSGPEPFELTKRFLDLTPGALPGFSLLTAFGQAAPLNLEYQESDRVLGFPFHFMNNNHVMNVKPKNYDWPEFYDHVLDITAYAFSRRAIRRRFQANRGMVPKALNVIRGISSEGKGRTQHFRRVKEKLETDRQFRDYFERETDIIPPFYTDWVRRDLGPLWEYLPEGALYHDPHAYLKAHRGQTPAALTVASRTPRPSLN